MGENSNQEKRMSLWRQIRGHYAQAARLKALNCNGEFDCANWRQIDAAHEIRFLVEFSYLFQYVPAEAFGVILTPGVVGMEK